MDVTRTFVWTLIVAVAAAIGCDASPSGGSAPDCSQLTVPSACPTPAPSWKGEVYGLFQTYCTQCHGAGGVAANVVPMAIYQDVFANRTRIWSAVYRCSMPGGQDAGVAPQAFPSLAERQAMITWADLCGAPDN